MNKMMHYLIASMLLILALSEQARSDYYDYKTDVKVNHNWSDLSQEQYIDNLVVCELILQAHKWSKNIWPKANKNPKPEFSEVVNIDEVLEKVRQNLTMESILVERFNTDITDEMLQHDLNRMAANTKDSNSLKALFSKFDNNPNTIAQCISRPYLIKQKIQNNYYFNSKIHSETQDLAHAELINYLKGTPAERLKAKVNTLTFSIDQEKTKNEETLIIPEEQTIKLSPDEYSHKAQQLQNSGLQEHKYLFFYSEIVQQTEGFLRVKTLTWKKHSFDLWLQEQKVTIDVPSLHDSYLTLPEITGSNKLEAVKAGVVADSWNSKLYAPDSRQSHSAVWTGSEMIIWGGMSNSGPSNTGGRYNPTTDSWVVTSVGDNVPVARRDHTAIWSGYEMIVWGGVNSFLHNLNSGGRYNPSTNSWLTTDDSSINVPTARSGHTAIWSGHEMIIWGGRDNSVENVNTGGRYNPITDSWQTTSIAANVPSVRQTFTAVWTGTEMIVWGGWDGNYLNTGGRYNPDTDSWLPTSIGTNVPNARSNHTAIWDGNEMIIWGGSDHSYVNTGGRYDPFNDCWVATSTDANVPSARIRHTAVWSGEEMIVWGGWNSDGLTNSVGKYNPMTDSWFSTTEVDNVPSPRIGHTAVWSGAEMIIWGGEEGASETNTGGRYNPADNSWTITSMASVPTGRYNHTAVWSGHEMIIWGGGFLNTGGRYNPITDSWISTSTGANVPSGRNEHTAIWSGSEMIIWGGYDGWYLNTGGRYDPSSDNWIPTNMAAVPSARRYHTAVWSGSEMIVWGGLGVDSEFQMHPNRTITGGRYNPETDSWEATSIEADVPSARNGHTAIWSGNEMIVWGGYNGSHLGYLDTGSRYDPVSDTWIATSLDAHVPSGRSQHTVIWTGNEMIVWGGINGSYLNTGGRYDPVSDSWLESSTGANVPTARRDNTAIWNGKEMIVWGGYDGSWTNTGGRYNPEADSWMTTNTGTNVPIARTRHTAIWSGSKMIIWGGSTPLGTNSLGIYYPDNLYTISGILTGLIEGQVVIQNNGTDDLVLTSDGEFEFSQALVENSIYEINILSYPNSPPQYCTVRNGTGYVMADVTDVVVQCKPAVDLDYCDSNNQQNIGLDKKRPTCIIK